VRNLNQDTQKNYWDCICINSDFEWSTHVEKISIELKKRIGLLRRIKNRLPKNKMIMIAEAIFNSKVRFGIAVYLKPIFEEEDLKMKRLSKNTTVLQTLQNRMIRVILGLKIQNHINMQHVRENIRMMSINQMAVYHTIIECYNIVRNSASEQIKLKWTDISEKKPTLRSTTNSDLKVPGKPKSKCTGFTYSGAKLYNMLPKNIRETQNSSTFKTLTKKWIWTKIPSQ
jgi:hypothetical protein